MEFRTNRHVIDLVFPIAVFFVFTASSLAVLMLAANIYHTQTTDADNNYMTRTSLAYVSEKIRQNDANGGISVRTVEDRSCLAIESVSYDVSYTTYIYEYEGTLKELFIRDDAKLRLKDGKDIMEVKEFSIEEIGDGLFRFASSDLDGNKTALIVSERSAP